MSWKSINEINSAMNCFTPKHGWDFVMRGKQGSHGLAILWAQTIYLD